ncbi:MAG: hypothetical protein NTX86_03210 [Candidatus Dependentiae bacterium]|nr:hypothetical protein [Candidatus Dependentiae bacterium]
MHKRLFLLTFTLTLFVMNNTTFTSQPFNSTNSNKEGQTIFSINEDTTTKPHMTFSRNVRSLAINIAKPQAQSVNRTGMQHAQSMPIIKHEKIAARFTSLATAQRAFLYCPSLSKQDENIIYECMIKKASISQKEIDQIKDLLTFRYEQQGASKESSSTRQRSNTR